MIDLVVAGGGPAGLATAIHAARAGLEVTLLEQRSGVLDKACGEGLMPHAVRQLDDLGIQPAGRRLLGVTYLDERHRVTAPFADGTGLGVRRTTLHAALLDEAKAAGVTMLTGKVDRLTQDDTAVTVHTAQAGAPAAVQARYLAAADGLHSPIRAQLGLDRPAGRSRRWGIRRHFGVAPWSDCVEVYWSAHTEAYVTPVADDCVGIAILTSQQGRFDDQLAAFPELLDRIDGHPHGRDRAAGPLRQRVRGRVAGRVLLVGDAAGYVDALTGEGLGLAFAAAQLLVTAVVTDSPADYEAAWRRATRRYRMLTAAMLHASTSPLRSVVVPAASRLPRVFTGVVNLLAD